MSKYSEFKEWLAVNSAKTQTEKVAVFEASLLDDGSAVEMAEEMESGKASGQDMFDACLCIAYADHCTAPLLARIAELEATLTEARSWIGDGEDSICSFIYPKQCSSDYVEMVNRVDAVLGKGGAA